MKFLTASFPLARFRGVEVRLHFSALFSLLAAYFLFAPETPREYAMALLWILGFFFSVLLHELGHAFAARLFGVEVKSVVVWLLGGFTVLRGEAQSPRRRLAISAAGPLANMLLAFFCVAGYAALQIFLSRQNYFLAISWFLFLQSLATLLFSLAAVNLLLAFFNLLPVYPLDGGGVLRALAEELFGKAKADWIAIVVGVPILLGLFACGLFAGDYLLVVSVAFIALALGTLSRPFLRKMNESARYLLRPSEYYFLREDFDRAIQAFTSEIEREPQEPKHYVMRAACLLNLNQTERCKADVERALRLDPNYPLALLMRGELLLVEKDPARALEFFERALQLQPNLAVAHFDRASALMDQKQFSAALEELNRAIELGPQTALFHLARSIVHFRLGDLVSAHRDEDEAARLDEKRALTLGEYNLSVYEEYFDWAEDYYGRIIALHPRLAYAYWGRGNAYRANRLYEQAASDYDRALELAPQEAELYLRRGMVWQALNELEKSAADFETAARLADKPHIKRQAAEALKRLQSANSNLLPCCPPPSC